MWEEAFMTFASCLYVLGRGLVFTNPAYAMRIVRKGGQLEFVEEKFKYIDNGGSELWWRKEITGKEDVVFLRGMGAFEVNAGNQHCFSQFTYNTHKNEAIRCLKL